MPIQIGDKIFRNIQEQVGKNQADINALKLAQAFGFKNIGTLDEASDIPEGTYHYGEFYFIGTQAPYEVYIYTNHDGTDEFINLGTLAGPQGNIGLPGSTGTVEIVATVTGEPGSDASVVNTGTPSAAKLIFIIPKGAAGPQGPVGSRGLIGPVGPEGPQGIQGIPGDPGQSFMIVGTITSEAQLPDAATTPRNYAYVYNDEDPTTPNRLYYIIGDEGEEEWSYSSFAVAGTTVYSNGNPIYTFDADTKLDKVTTPDTYARVYTVAGNGTQTMQNTSVEIISGDSCIVRRVPLTGDVKVPETPSYNDAAASKKYVDSIILAVYPVGSIYTSVNNTSPATLFGGTWTALNGGNPIKIPTANNVSISSSNYWLKQANGYKAQITPLSNVNPGATGNCYIYNNTGSAGALQSGNELRLDGDGITATFSAIDIYMWQRVS